MTYPGKTGTLCTELQKWFLSIGAERNTIFTNYGPVSLLPQLEKKLEKILNDKLVPFVDKHNIINENQYGFRI